jgi:hypothetical protein
VKQAATDDAAAIQVDGLTYVPASRIEQELRISRQTLWRWRTMGKIPAGHVYRERQVVFTTAEAEEIYEYANRVRPAPERVPRQIRLFRKSKEPS